MRLNAFNLFKKEHGKTYGEQEEQDRLAIFTANLDMVSQMNNVTSKSLINLSAIRIHNK